MRSVGYYSPLSGSGDKGDLFPAKERDLFSDFLIISRTRCDKDKHYAFRAHEFPSFIPGEPLVICHSGLHSIARVSAVDRKTKMNGMSEDGRGMNF